MTHFFPIYYIILSIVGVATFTHAPLLLKLILDCFTKKVDAVPGKSEAELYIESRKRKFAATFQLEDANENMQPLIFVAEEELKDENNETEKTWSRRILMESTPRGNLLMVYNAFKQSFDYYSDNHIPYLMLNAAAMKFVTVFRCRDLFVDENEIPEGHVSKLATMNRQKEESKKKEDASNKQTMLAGPFVKPKKPPSNGEAKSGAEKKEEPKMKNKFSYRGKMVNFSVLNKPKKVFATNGFKSGLLNFGEQLSYAEYKKKLSGTQ